MKFYSCYTSVIFLFEIQWWVFSKMHTKPNQSVGTEPYRLLVCDVMGFPRSPTFKKKVLAPSLGLKPEGRGLDSQ
jgi:hypothetical protein